VREGVVEATLDRAGLWAVQTPQAFRADLLREAHEKARRDGVSGTDDAMLVERLGHPVRVVPGLARNVKITTPEDLRRARARR
jgi:2-C-methyl-D-erythritol 4-phosphate cytidylyltransferase